MAERSFGSAVGRGLRSTAPAAPRARWLGVRAIGVAVAAALAIDAYVHASSAQLYDGPHGGLLTEGNLFRVEALVSGLLALAVLVRPSRRAFGAALVVAATALAAVVVYRYIDVGTIGPLPDLYEPTWQVPGKLPSAIAEGIAVLLTLAGILLTRVRKHSA